MSMIPNDYHIIAPCPGHSEAATRTGESQVDKFDRPAEGGNQQHGFPQLYGHRRAKATVCCYG